MDVVLVATTHWDREWYRTFQAFRARLVDTVDRVLELLEADPGYTFLLDGQSIVLEDYLEIRPGRRAALQRHARAGRIEIGPWYVQPDSLLPDGESHVRNLIEGRRVAESIGPASRIAYTPDSFGHPAQFPQIFRGFGIEHFVYWRGNGNEIAELPSEYRWVAPSGDAVLACHLWLGYGNAAGLPADAEVAAERLTRAVEDLARRTTSGRVLLLAGTDHQPPDAHTGEVARALEARTGWTVRRGLLRDFVDDLLPSGERPAYEGELMGARVANLLPGVWSTRTYLKLRHRACETALLAWAEPWSALGSRFGLPDERPALRSAWRNLLENQAHDSICGCSQDAVHEQMLARYDYARELAQETTRRVCERLAGLDVTRRVPWTDEVELAVFNPSPYPRTDVVRFPVQGYPPFDQSQRHSIHPLNWINMRLDKGWEVDGRPARRVAVDTGDRVRLINEQSDFDVEFVAEDVPAFGYRTFRLRPSPAHPDEVDGGRRVTNGSVTVEVQPDATLAVSFAGRRYEGLFALEDVGDRGDTYDFDPVWGDVQEGPVSVERIRHESGIELLRIRRTLSVPALGPDRSSRWGEEGNVDVTLEARVAPGVERVDAHILVSNDATDHRLRLLFPTGGRVETFAAATTFDVARRRVEPRDASSWLHPAPSTFPAQGWVHANGLMVVAPGLYEAEVTPDGVIALTLLRSVGWLSRMDLRTRPMHAGPALPTPGAQCRRTIEATVSLFSGLDAERARDAEVGLLCVPAGSAPPLNPGRSLVSLEPRGLWLTALKPAEMGAGIVVRVLNPSDEGVEAALHFGFPVRRATSVRLDEAPDGRTLNVEAGVVRLHVPPHTLRSVLLE